MYPARMFRGGRKHFIKLVICGRQFAAVLVAQMNDQTRVLVTGSDGFVGRHLVPYLASRGYKVIAASRGAPSFEDPNIKAVLLPDLSMPCDWRPLLQQCDAVIHLAGIAHHFAADDLYDLVNHRATAALADAALRFGTTHLVFVSSILAQSGPSSEHELTEDGPPRPNSPYGRSKLAAERAIRAAGVPFTILRPVVIHGDGEKGNFATLYRVSRLPIPLPFGKLTAQRSVLSIHNFNSAIAAVLSNPRARGETFILSDPMPVTVAELVASHRASLGRPSWLVPLPERWLELSLKAVGQSAMWERIGRSQIAKPSKLLAIGWKPIEPNH
jgi:nucleoside-diphosphate-sugar epimerase